MDNASGMTTEGNISPSKKSPEGKASGFQRVYQACVRCRQKKQRCILGNPASPKPPCQTCRRANLSCVLPEEKRRGRPPKRHLDADVEENPSTAPLNPDQGQFGASDGARKPGVASRSARNTLVGNADHASTGPFGSTHSAIHEPSTSYDRQMARQNLATFPLRNTSDAIKLLDQGSDQAPHGVDGQQDRTSSGVDVLGSVSARRKFFLLEEGFINETTLLRLFNFYLGSVHVIMPLIPFKRMPTTPDHTLAMASQEPHLMAAILVVSASLVGDQALHMLLWRRAQHLFAEVALIGARASIGVIEGLILLSEYPPNMSCDTTLDFEDRMCWMTVGTAVRLGYLLGLEQTGMPIEDVDEKLVEHCDRGKVAWSYCYCLDRQISIRVGKAFWHRSPGMTYHHLHIDPAEDFPEMRDLPGIQDNYAGYLQCLIQITQILSNAHDLLYPSKSRSIALAKAEHYYKHIDEFAETLSAFRNRWQKRPWRTYPINECVWISFHHLRLYVYSFSLQAYMQRAPSSNNHNNSSSNRPLDYFPTGLMGSSDARFIVEATNAAADVLRLAIGRLQPSGALSYLPLRFFLFCSHAGVFLLKAAVVVPLPPSQKRAILRLIRALIRCMATVSSDTKHPGVRYSAALDRLLGRVYRDKDHTTNNNNQTPSLTRPSSPRMMDDADTGVGAGTHAGHGWTDSTTTVATDAAPAALGDYNDLSALLGNTESPFVAERPFRELAADIDAFYGFAPEDPGVDLQPSADSSDLYTLFPPFDPFVSLFGSGESWEGATQFDDFGLEHSTTRPEYTST